MSQPELERERGEFEKWIESLPHCLGYAGGCDGGMGIAHEEDCPLYGKDFATHYDAWLSSQQSTFRRVRAILGNSIIIDADKPLVRDVLAAIEREFGGAEEK